MQDCEARCGFHEERLGKMRRNTHRLSRAGQRKSKARLDEKVWVSGTE